jgi:lantibiotic leader peptide-processing serine protease
MRKVGVWLAILVLLIGVVPATAAQTGDEREFVVVYEDGASLDAARAAIAAAGGTIVKENGAVGVATVRTRNPNFAAAARQQRALGGVARSKPIGVAPRLAHPQREDVERATRDRLVGKGQIAAAQRDPNKKPGPEPLADLQWDMQMIHATADGSYRVQRGDKDVLVGVIDTGIDALHPDIKPNFNRRLSRNFTTDIPLVDGPCEDEPDHSCEDPADVDEGGHGTHVAGTIAAALNDLGVAGVAPNVTLVNLRAGQDSGYFFLQSTVDALTYAGDIGVDVVNMSFFTDPWLYNCASNPADSPEEQAEQRAIIKATQRALNYARKHGVTLVAALGNEHTDLGNPTTDTISPDFPPDAAKTRTVDNSCLTMPTEGDGVIAVSAIGPSEIKADYSNYGVEQTDVAAPGGYFRDFFGTDKYRTPGNMILSTYPADLAIAEGADDPTSPNYPFFVKDCKDGVCAYYQYLQGTSMASPHAAGVAALIVSEFGKKDKRHGGLGLDPSEVRRILKRTATEHACPDPPLVDYTNVGRPPEFNALCVGDKGFNGFYGSGIVDALRAVRHGD